VVLRDRIAHVVLGDNASEFELTFLRIPEIGWRVHTRVHEVDKLLGGDLRTQVEHVPTEVRQELLLVEQDDGNVQGVVL